MIVYIMIHTHTHAREQFLNLSVGLGLGLVFGRPFVKRFALCHRTVVCLSVCLSVCPALSVTLVYCGQTVRQIKMKLRVQVGLGLGQIVLDGDPAPLPKGGRALQFLADICCGQMAGWIKMPLDREVGLSPSDIVLDGDPALPLPVKGAQQPPPSFRPMSIVAAVAHLSCC